MAQMPLRGDVHITSTYGRRTHPITGEVGSWHGGLDLVSSDRAVLASAGGVVAVSQIVTDKSNATWQWGNYVCIYGNDGNLVYYCHLAERLVTTGQRVEAGEQIGVMGTTGYSTGVHLHFEVRDTSNEQLDAAVYLGIENKVGAVSVDETESSADWWSDAVEWAKAQGIVKGGTDGDLMLDKSCTRREVITMLYRALGGGS